MPSSVVWSSAFRNRGLRNVTIAALPRRSIEAPGSSIRPSFWNFGSSSRDSSRGSSMAVTEMPAAVGVAEDDRQEQALVDLQPRLLALAQAVLGRDLLRRRHQARETPATPSTTSSSTRTDRVMLSVSSS